jgi:hypothetical protein
MASTARRRLISRILALQPHEALLFAFLPGLVLVVGSYLLGIDHLATPPDAIYSGTDGLEREVGYIPALNWSITYLLLFPLSLYFMLSSVQGIAYALGELHARGMVRNNESIINEPIIRRAWINGSASRTRLLWIFSFIGPIIYSVGEWFRNNLLRQFGHGPQALYPDYDWGLAGVMLNWSTSRKILNVAFDCVAFCTEGALLATSFAFFIILLDVRRTLQKRADTYIVPDLSSKGVTDVDDVRRGFEVFSVPLQHMLLSALTSYLICYLVRLENAYMHGTGAPDLVKFISGEKIADIVVFAFSDWKHLPAELLRLLEPGPNPIRAVLACAVFGLVSMFSLIVIISTVRTAAAEARINAGKHFAAKSTPLFGGPIDAEIDRAQSMQIWPISYIGLNALIVVTLLAFVSLYFYRIGIYFALLTLVAILIKASKKIIKGSSESR